MLTVLRPKAQITIPSSIISSLGLKEGDQLDICEDNGAIRIIPVVTYPKEYVNRLHAEIIKLKEDVQNGRQPVFRDLDSLFEDLDSE